MCAGHNDLLRNAWTDVHVNKHTNMSTTIVATTVHCPLRCTESMNINVVVQDVLTVENETVVHVDV